MTSAKRKVPSRAAKDKAATLPAGSDNKSSRHQKAWPTRPSGQRTSRNNLDEVDDGQSARSSASSSVSSPPSSELSSPPPTTPHRDQENAKGRTKRVASASSAKTPSRPTRGAASSTRTPSEINDDDSAITLADFQPRRSSRKAAVISEKKIRKQVGSLRRGSSGEEDSNEDDEESSGRASKRVKGTPTKNAARGSRRNGNIRRRFLDVSESDDDINGRIVFALQFLTISKGSPLVLLPLFSAYRCRYRRSAEWAEACQ
jgi:hypothetical protein